MAALAVLLILILVPVDRGCDPAVVGNNSAYCVELFPAALCVPRMEQISIITIMNGVNSTELAADFNSPLFVFSHTDNLASTNSNYFRYLGKRFQWFVKQ